MADVIPEDVRTYLNEFSDVWREYCGDAETFSSALDALPQGDESTLYEILSDSLTYIHETTHRVTIYQEALDQLRSGRSQYSVDVWLAEQGYPVEHNQLRAALVRRIGQAFQNVVTLIQVT